MIKFKKSEIVIITLLYFALIIFFARNPFIYLIYKDSLTITTIFIIFALFELLFYVHNNFDLTPIIFYTSLCNSILGYLYYHFNNLYINFCNNLPESIECKCDVEWIALSIRNYKIIAKWIEFFSFFIFTWIILKFVIFRILYLKKFKTLKKAFIIFNLVFLIIYLIISGYFYAIYSSSYGYYHNRLFSQDPYGMVIEHYHLSENNILYSMPNDYYTQLLNWLRVKW